MFMRQSARRCQKELTHIDDDAMALLKAHAWPGNIRQLENVIERAVVICDKPYLSVQELPAEIARRASPPRRKSSFRPRRPRSPSRHRGRCRARAERDQLEREQAGAAAGRRRRQQGGGGSGHGRGPQHAGQPVEEAGVELIASSSAPSPVPWVR